MSGFKLIAIRPLSGCDKRFLKILKPNELYSFCSDYKFHFKNNDKEDKVISIESMPEIPKNFWNIKTSNNKNIDVNISAIVGKNGSGKSSILELLYATIYIGASLSNVFNFEKKYEDNKNHEKNNFQKAKGEIEHKIEKLENLKYENFGKDDYDDFLQNEIQNCKEEVDELTIRNENYNNRVSSCISELMQLQSSLNIELFYALEGKIYCLQIKDNGVTQNKKPILNLTEIRKDKLDELNNKDLNQFDIKKFFYSIALNYSTYGLNSRDIGYWIENIFHKNDGYKTPIVINPMRTEGKFDINDENEFATYRLLHNILIQKYLSRVKEKTENIYITDNQYVEKIRFSVNRTKKIPDKILENKHTISGEEKSVNLIIDMISVFFDGKKELDFHNNKAPFKTLVCNYIVKKIEKITSTYEEYQKDSSTKNQKKKNIDRYFLEKFKDDDSHITFKLKQALNYLITNSDNTKASIWKKLEESNGENDHVDFTLNELLDWMDFENASEIITHIPPSVFNIEIMLSDTEKLANEKKEPTFGDLSSGEQQLIHSIQSVLYHLNNLQSVHNSNDNRISYKYINIIFDEIELYFHPDYQRRFIDELLKSISRLDLGEQNNGIQSINILLSTHSPFILSDIPISNILKLEKGNPNPYSNSEHNTFGANIHDMLADEFYLKGGFMGEFAKKKIEEIIELLNSDKKPDKRKAYEIEKVINIVGEPFLREKLQEMLYKIDPDLKNTRLKLLQNEIDKIKKL